LRQDHGRRLPSSAAGTRHDLGILCPPNEDNCVWSWVSTTATTSIMRASIEHCACTNPVSIYSSHEISRTYLAPLYHLLPPEARPKLRHDSAQGLIYNTSTSAIRPSGRLISSPPVLHHISPLDPFEKGTWSILLQIPSRCFVGCLDQEAAGAVANTAYFSSTSRPLGQPRIRRPQYSLRVGPWPRIPSSRAGPRPEYSLGLAPFSPLSSMTSLKGAVGHNNK
jgi:hypothetical protein